MDQTIARRVIRLVCVLAVLAGLAMMPIAAKGEKRKPERFRGNALSIGTGKTATARVDIVISRWTTPEERQALLTVLAEGGSKALSEALTREPEAGFVLVDQERKTLRYARQWEQDGKRMIVAATDRPVRYGEIRHSARSADKTVSLVQLALDEDGSGEGSMALAVELILDKANNRLIVENQSLQPVRLDSIKKVK